MYTEGGSFKEKKEIDRFSHMFEYLEINIDGYLIDTL